jgi:hypothetical protein
LLLSACGGGGGSDSGPDTGTDSGQVMIGITDADGDFVRYVVSIESMTLEREDGSVVDTMPSSVSTDLAQLVDATELFSSITVPQGTYTAAHLRINYTDADVAVERDGQTADAVVVDANGQNPGTVDVDLNFDALSRLVVRPGVPALLNIDFDLASSNSVDLSTTPVTVTAEPFLVADLDAADGKELHLGGTFQSADTSGSTYSIDLRPFLRHDGNFGGLTIHVTDATTYEVDGTPYTGADGLAALAAMDAGSPTRADVTFNATDKSLTATSVLAGSSVPGASLDAVQGWVTQRDGDTLHMRGVTLVRQSGDVSFTDDVEVTLGSDLVVRQEGNPEASLDATSISVGQRLTAGGTLNMDNAALPTMDASFARLLETHVSGDVTSANPGTLVVGLDAVDARAPSDFDYAGTGVDANSDANADAYEIDTGTIDLSGIAAGTPVRVFGFVTPFGAAPPDFQASTVEDVTNASWRMDLDYPDGSTDAFTSLEAGSGDVSATMVLNLSDDALGNIHTLRRGGVFTDLQTLPASPSIVGATDGHRIYGIIQNGDVQVFLDYDRFVAELTSRMDGSVMVMRFHAVGHYDEGTNTFAAERVAIQLQ